jgi:hypothetical protein
MSLNPKVAVTVRGKYYYGNATASAVDVLSLSPLNLDARCIALSDQYMLFRFTKLHARCVQPGGSDHPIFMGFTPALPTTNPSSPQETLDCAVSAWGSNPGRFGNPAPQLKLNKKILTTNGPKWFRRGTAFDDLLEVQGRVFTTSTVPFNTNIIYLVFEWEMELAAPLSAADTVSGTPARDERFITKLAQLREERKERDERELVLIDRPRAEPDPVLDKIKDLLLRDNMTRVDQR